MSSAINYTTNHKYRIVDYSSEWPIWFAREAGILRRIFGSTIVSIDHVGSTAIPGMPAKPQLDILIQVKNVDETDSFSEALKAISYESYGDALRKGGRLYSRWENGEKVVNLHIFPSGSAVAREYIAIREYLLSHPQEAKDYAALKLDLYAKYPEDYLKYREFKDPYIIELLGRIV